MSLFHNSEEMEIVAQRHHVAWAVTSLMSAAMALMTAAFLVCGLNPTLLVMFFRIQIVLQLTITIYGLTAFIYHMKGARDHEENRKRLLGGQDGAQTAIRAGT